jgi:hypothetical protein
MPQKFSRGEGYFINGLFLIRMSKQHQHGISLRDL